MARRSDLDHVVCEVSGVGDPGQLASSVEVDDAAAPNVRVHRQGPHDPAQSLRAIAVAHPAHGMRRGCPLTTHWFSSQRGRVPERSCGPPRQRSLRSWDPGRPRVHEPHATSPCPSLAALPLPREGDDPGYPACVPQWLHQLRTSTQDVGRGGGHRSGGIRAGPQQGGRSSQRALRVQRGGGTPRPPRDSALGPTNNELDREPSGAGAVGKVVLIGLAVVVAPFTVLVIIGCLIGFF